MDLFFNAMMAWNQMIMIFVGVVFLALGGAMIGWTIYRRKVCVRVQAKIKAIRATGAGKLDESGKPRRRKKSYAKEMYSAIYEFRGPDGEMIEAEGKGSESWITGKRPGTAVDLLVNPNDLSDVNRPGWILEAFGAVFALPGIFLIYLALTTFESTPMTYIFLIGGLAWIGFKAKKIIKPKDKWETVSQFKKRMKEKVKKKRSKGRLLTDQEINDRFEKSAKSKHKSAPILALIGVFCLGIGGFFGNDMRGFLKVAEPATGEVTDMDARSSDDGTSYYAIVTYETFEGREFAFTDNMGSSHPSLKRGDIVDVLYKPADPSDAIIDRGIFNWAMSGIFLMVGLLFLLFAYMNRPRSAGKTVVPPRRMSD